MKFEPIAIVGRGCVLPGANNPEELWRVVAAGETSIGPPPEGDWRIDLKRVISDNAAQYKIDHTWSDRGGYIREFDRLFDPASTELDPELVAALDPLFRWSFFAGRQALDSCRRLDGKTKSRTGVVLGNLSYPSRGHNQYAERVLLEKLFGLDRDNNPPLHPYNRFNSGLPAMLTARALGLSGNSLALDAACASGLYAIKIACDRLQSGRASAMLAGAVNAADPLFIHIGFSALNALSRTGQSRPFHAEADGLVPSEGAAFVLLKRLDDAVESGDQILGVIRGIGLSNDGRSGGFLTPSVAGQVRCLRRAYSGCDVEPKDISYIECHATGTPAGDGAEISSMLEVFGNKADLALGSLKANLGHLITTSGVAGLIKVLGVFENEQLPPTPNSRPLLGAIADSSLKVPTSPEPYGSRSGRMLAGVSSFGFGGNNAHLIVERYKENSYATTTPTSYQPTGVALVGIGVRTDLSPDLKEFTDLLLNPGKINGVPSYLDSVTFPARELGFPPNDLKQALGQQLLIMELAHEVLAELGPLDATSSGVYIGMGTDSEICRYGLRLRLEELLADRGISVDEGWLAEAGPAISDSLRSAGVIGKMPNIPANRLSNYFDIQGPGFTVSAEELSGDAALDMAMTALARGEIEAALVGAVDLSREQVHEHALAEAHQNPKQKSADGAVLMVLKNIDRAKSDGDEILAVINHKDESDDEEFIVGNYPHNNEWNRNLGEAHAASGLLNIAAAVQLVRMRARPAEDSIEPQLSRGRPIRAAVRNSSFAGESGGFTIEAAAGSVYNGFSCDPPVIETYAAADRAGLKQALASRNASSEGAFRLALVSTKKGVAATRERAISLLEGEHLTDGWNLDGIFFREAPIGGDLAFAFTGAASAYSGMGRELLLGLPSLSDKLSSRLNNADYAAGWAYKKDDPRGRLPFYQLAGCSFLCQAHAMLSLNLLGLKPQASLGLSSGETNSMFAFGVWNDMDGLLRDIDESDLYTEALGGSFDSVKKHWGLNPDENINWDNWRVLAPVENVIQALAAEDRTYLTIINSSNDCIIGGDHDSCSRVIEQLGGVKTIPMGHDLAVHCAAVEPFAPEWKRLHTRKTSHPAGIRFYSNYFGGEFEITRESVAEALTGQALQTIDFPKIINLAWEDGVRVFVEHGPRQSLCTAIDTILGEKPHLAVPLDRAGVNGIIAACRAAAELWCAGVNVDLAALTDAVNGCVHSDADQKDAGPTISFKLRPPEMTPPPLPEKEKNLPTPRLPAPDPGVAIYSPPVPAAGPTTGRRMAPPPPLARISRPVEDYPKETPSTSRIENQPTKTTPAGPPKTTQKVAESKPAEESMPRLTQQFVKPPTISSESRPVTPIAAATASTATGVGVNAAGLIVNAHREMQEVHQNYIRMQNKAQAEFNELMTGMQNLLFGATAGGSFDQIKPPPPEHLPSPPGGVIAPTFDKIDQTENAIQSPSLDQHDLAPQISPDKKTDYPGPQIDREQLKILAGGRISTVLGPLFEQQDDYHIQTRMPEPPLLLCDRVLGIKGEAGSMGQGTIWTETDVRADSWYLHNGRMPGGIFIEAGQADLLLISWLGIDFHNKGERAYRLLGCELVFHGDLPRPGDTLEYEITVDGHAKQGDIRLFFFHYDCHINGKLSISVRNGQAGFFSVDELENSAGVLWSPEEANYTPNPTLDPPPVECTKNRFSISEVAAYADGDLLGCFGEGYEWSQTHTRTPRTPSGKFNFIGEVVDYNPVGGPAGRGSLIAESPVSPDDWFFEGHFKNDPCMPGTLMAEACLQMMAFYLTATGRTLRRDGWRFQPVRDVNYKFVCRGQVIPQSKKLVYEVYVDEIIDGEMPILYAHVLCSVDGRKAFMCERLGLQLVPDWPMTDAPQITDGNTDPRPLAKIGDFPLDYQSLISCALGQPSLAFGEGFSRYDGPIRSPRLPGPPYHFMTRILSLAGEMGKMEAGASVEAVYDIPTDAWYFEDNGAMTMPYCVLMEIALQPCGWLASYTLSPEVSQQELLFRNLDGKAHQFREIIPGDPSITTRVKLKSISKAGSLIIVGFDVQSLVGEEIIFDMDTVFGFFPPEAMINQKGLKVEDYESGILSRESDFYFDLKPRAGKYFGSSSARLPDSKLLMIDRITGFWPEGGQHKLGAMRAEKDVNVSEWFFKAHFFQDPVQPGSLGIEAMLQLMQAYMIETGRHLGINNPRFEPIDIKGQTSWHYRGQVTPDKKMITIDFEVIEEGRDDRGPFVIGDARLWVDGLKIYQAPRIGMRIIEGGPGIAGGNDKSKETGNRTALEPVPIKEALVISEPPAFEWRAIREYWIKKAGGKQRFIHDLGASLTRAFVRKFIITSPESFAAFRGKPVLYLGNHQTAVESFLFLIIISALSNTSAAGLAKDEHQESWIGNILRLSDLSLGKGAGPGILFLNRENQSEMLRLLDKFETDSRQSPCSLLVHTEGTRSMYGGEPVRRLSSVLLDLAIKAGIPIAPVRFIGGLPTKSDNKRRDFPYRLGKQDFIVGNFILPEQLTALPYAERSKLVIDAINNLGPKGEEDTPFAGDEEFNKIARAKKTGDRLKLPEILRAALETLPGPGDETKQIMASYESGELFDIGPDDPFYKAIRALIT